MISVERVGLPSVKSMVDHVRDSGKNIMNVSTRSLGVVVAVSIKAPP